MRDASMEDITKFLECKRVAIVGVSRDSKHFSRALFREFVAKGYDPIPVNPCSQEIEGRKCFPRLAEISPPVDAALLMTGTAEVTDQVVQESCQVRIRNIWIYGTPNGDSGRWVEFCRQRGSTVIEGYCPLMFLPRPGWFHRVHRVLLKLSGSHPL